MKGFIKKPLAVLLAVAAILPFTACGNMDVMDTNFTLNYAVLEENGQNVLHTVEKWSESESESLGVKTSCCGNYIWGSANTDKLYEKKPAEYAYDVECDDIAK